MEERECLHVFLRLMSCSKARVVTCLVGAKFSVTK